MRFFVKLLLNYKLVSVLSNAINSNHADENFSSHEFSKFRKNGGLYVRYYGKVFLKVRSILHGFLFTCEVNFLFKERITLQVKIK